MNTFAEALFITTAIDPSRSFRMTINVSLIMKPYRISSFRAEVRMLYEKTGRRLCDTERRIYYSDDTLPLVTFLSADKKEHP